MAITFKDATRACAKGSKQFSTCNVSSKYGLCASSPDTDSQWCCPPNAEYVINPLAVLLRKHELQQ